MMMPPIKCAWSNFDERFENPELPEICCDQDAEYISCKPFFETPTCESHRCRCARPLSIDIQGRSYLEDLRGQGAKLRGYSIVPCERHRGDGLSVYFEGTRGEIAIFCRGCEREVQPHAPKPIKIIPVQSRRGN